MASFDIIRVYSTRAREGAAQFNARASWPARLLFWVIALPLAFLFLALLLLVVLVITAVAAAKATVWFIRARFAGLFGGALRGDGRRNVRVIPRDPSA